MRDQSHVTVSPWYPLSLPDELNGGRGGMSTRTPASLNGEDFDYAVIGGGIGGFAAATHLAQLLPRVSKATAPIRIVLLDRKTMFNEKSSMSGGQISIGLSVDHRWGFEAVGQDATDEFNRRTILAVQGLKQAALNFERDYFPDIAADGLLTAIEQDDQMSWALNEALYFNTLFAHDLKHEASRRNDHQISIGSLARNFHISTIKPQHMPWPGRYRYGIHNPGEFAVNPAMLGVTMKERLLSAIRDPVKLDIVEHISARSVNAHTGEILCEDRQGTPIQLRAGRVLMAGIPPEVLHSHSYTPTQTVKSYQSLLSVTEPLPQDLRADFKSAVHDTSDVYNYFWLDPESGRLVWGSGDFEEGSQFHEQIQATDREIRKTLGRGLKLSHVWAGDIPYTDDGMPLVIRNGRAAGFYAPGGRGLAASVALGHMSASALLYEGGRDDQLMHALMRRQDGFDAGRLAAKRPDYLKPPLLINYEPPALDAVA